LEKHEKIDSAQKKEFNALNNQLYWHLRSFFWELIATYDTILQWVNSNFEIGLNESDVNYNNVKKNVSNAKKDVKDCKIVFSKLEVAHETEWFFEVRNYRNFSHRSFLNVQLEIGDDYGKSTPHLIRVSLNPARDGQIGYGDLVTQLTDYLNHIHDLLQDIFN